MNKTSIFLFFDKSHFTNLFYTRIGGKFWEFKCK